MPEVLHPDQLLKLNIPLYNIDKQYMGAIVLYRNVRNKAIDTQTLIQVEQFRRALVQGMENLERFGPESESR